MRRLLLIITLAALLYAGFWALAARSTLAEARALADDLRAAGWQVGWDDMSLRGFPSRLDLTIDAPQIEVPGGTGWSAPFVQSLQLTYRRNRAILAFADTQTLTLAGTPVAVTARGLRASVRGAEVTAEAETLSLAWDDQTISAGPLLAALRPDPGAPGAVQVYLRAENAVAEDTPLGTLQIEGSARLDAPLSAVAPPRLTSFDLTGLETTAPEALAAVLATLSPAAAEAVQRQ